MKSSGKKQTSASNAQQEETALIGKIALLEALCTGLDRRQEVLGVLEAAEDPGSALETLQAELDLNPEGAQAVLDLQLRRLTSSERDRTAAELEEAHVRLHKMRQESTE